MLEFLHSAELFLNLLPIYRSATIWFHGLFDWFIVWTLVFLHEFVIGRLSVFVVFVAKDGRFLRFFINLVRIESDLVGAKRRRINIHIFACLLSLILFAVERFELSFFHRAIMELPVAALFWRWVSFMCCYGLQSSYLPVFEASRRSILHRWSLQPSFSWSVLFDRWLSDGGCILKLLIVGWTPLTWVVLQEMGSIGMYSKCLSSLCEILQNIFTWDISL